MKITINTEVLQRENLSLGDFLVLLIGYNDMDYKESFDKLVNRGIIQPNVFKKTSMVLSNNTKDYISKLLMDSDDKIVNSGFDFDHLARKLQDIYPQGLKPGTTYSWKGSTEIITHKLKTLVVKYNFPFTEEEAIRATKEYVSSFGKDNKKMSLLKNFILTTKFDSHEMNSMFMTIIENNR